MNATIFWALGPWPGRLAIVPRPRGGDWLEDEVGAWRTAGLDVIVSTLEPHEVDDFDLGAEADLCRARQIEFVGFEIEDRNVPAASAAVANLARDLGAKLAAGKNVAVHCRQGIGRSALVAGCVLVAGGLDAAAAFERLSAARGCAVPETAEQREWVERFARALAAGMLG